MFLSCASGQSGALFMRTEGAGATISCVRCAFQLNTVSAVGTGRDAVGGAVYMSATGGTITMYDASVLTSTASADNGATIVGAVDTSVSLGGAITLDRLRIDGTTEDPK